jgi:hypothetical protein
MCTVVEYLCVLLSLIMPLVRYILPVMAYMMSVTPLAGEQWTEKIAVVDQYEQR